MRELVAEPRPLPADFPFERPPLFFCESLPVPLRFPPVPLPALALVVDFRVGARPVSFPLPRPLPLLRLPSPLTFFACLAVSFESAFASKDWTFLRSVSSSSSLVLDFDWLAFATLSSISPPRIWGVVDLSLAKVSAILTALSLEVVNFATLVTLLPVSMTRTWALKD